MKTLRLRQIIFALVATVAFVLPEAARACSVCFGNSSSSLTQGAKWGVITLLFVVAGVLGTFLTFIIALVVRARRFAAVQQAGAPAIEGN